MKSVTHIFSSFLLVMLMAGPIHLFAQDSPKADKKQQQEIVLQKNRDTILKLADARTFVIKANRLHDKYFNEYNVSSTVNFVKVDSSNAVVQFAFNGLVGSNGLGGLTAEGKISGYKVIPGRSISDPQRIRFYTSTSEAGHLTFFLTLYNEGKAQATVSDMYGSRLTFTGELAALDGSGIYQGTTLYY